MSPAYNPHRKETATRNVIAAGRGLSRYVPARLMAVAVLFSLSVLSIGASAADATPDDYKISIKVDLVVLPVSVTDRRGDFVTGLHAQDFRVYENGLPQKVTLFEPEDVPVTVGLVIDSSSSMAAKRPEVIAAAMALVESSNPHDEVFIVDFNQRVHLGLPRSIAFTSDLETLRDALSRTKTTGGTALYDGVGAALDHLKAGTGERKALVIVTDGEDNASRIKFQSLLRYAESSSCSIYAVGVFDPDYVENPGVLRQLAKATGGQAYFPGSLSDITETTRRIAADIRRQYTLGYIPPNKAPDGRFRPIRVKARVAGEGRLRVRTRTGYLIPGDASAAAVAVSQW
jgi:Ca-activated chloride channel homolog